MEGGITAAQGLPEGAIDVLLGASLGDSGARGIANIGVNLGKQVSAFAQGEFASKNDWQAMAGLKMRW